MARNAPIAALAALGLLAACGTPQEQCISRQTRELRTVTNLLAEVEGNLARGYAWEEREVLSREWDDCARVVRGRNGERDVIFVPCMRTVSDTERYRVPIDPAAEMRKRDGLRERRAVLTRQAEAGVRACRAAYPEEKPAQ
ncbi:hypothetical protein [Paracoccus pacificus]|uniref:Lysozyme inhibitor LprI N-terminal domain-containing protein n=1 Tax=Paracoccus pacificus TaxID=1463598 RepID=A0ABW4RBI1_9RHOB